LGTSPLSFPDLSTQQNHIGNKCRSIILSKQILLIPLKKINMTTIKLTINERTGKGKHLLALLKELAKSDKDIILIENENEPNSETLKAMKEAEVGLVTMVDSVDELFNSI
jgi:hypothetical protein